MSGPGTPHWEKQGNTAWVSCPACRAWFPVAPSLVARGDVALACPGCARLFPPAQAAEIEQP
jgi:hypothetical protein